MVASLVKGRARIRDERFKEPVTADAVRERLLSLRGIIAVTVNRRVGSLLILYDAAATGIEEILERLSPYANKKRSADSVSRRSQTMPPARRGGGRYPREAIAAGMLLSLLATVAAAAGSTGIHVAAGVLFLGLSAVHVARHRQALLRLQGSRT